MILTSVDSLFRAGTLLLGDNAPAMAPQPEPPVLVPIMVAGSVLMAILFIRNLINILPYLADNFTRARGSLALENSVRVSRDRNIIALALIIPFLLVINRWGLYSPDFLEGKDTDTRFLIIAGIFIVYLLVRRIVALLCNPSYGRDNFQTARKAAYSFFILCGFFALPTLGLMVLFGANELAVRNVLLIEMILVYLIYLYRKSQILSLSYGPLAVFLYLCGLELLPTGLLVASALVF